MCETYHETYMANISPDRLRVDLYQRELETKKVNDICRKFNMDLFNPLKVSHRPDGFYYVFDGQHSMVVHKRIFGEDTPINCKVFEGLTYDDEVYLFNQQNGISSKVNTNDNLKAEFTKAKSDVRDMVNAARSIGVVIDFKNYPADNHISATGAAYSVWCLVGEKDFLNVLSVIKEAWFGEATSYSAGFLKGLAYVYKRNGDKIKNDDVAKSLGRNTPNWYISRAKDKHGSLGLRYAQLFVEAYNHGRRNRLEEPRGT